MSLISVSNVTFAHEGNYINLFEDMSFKIDTSWKLGFVGRNGKGKTTFLKLLLGEHEYKGSISSTEEFLYFPLEVENEENMVLYIMEEFAPSRMQWEIEKELSLLQVNAEVLYRPFKTLSNGERTKVLLASLFLKEHVFLLIDEPTNHLDIQARKVVGEYLNKKQGFILVSHDRQLLNACTDHTLSLNRNSMDIQKGNYVSWYENKQRQNQFEATENEKLRKDIKRLEAAAKQTAEWAGKVEKTKKVQQNADGKPDRGYVGHQAARMMKRSKATEGRRQKAADEKSGLLKDIEEVDELFLPGIAYPKETLAVLKDVQVQYDKAVPQVPLNLTVQRGDKIALRGINGSGKSSILKLFTTESTPYTGNLVMGSGLAVSYVPQDTAFLKGPLAGFIDENKLDEPLYKAILRKLGFEREQFEKSMEQYSAGQKKKVLVAKSFCEKVHLYVWDEPLNFIDVLSREQIEQALMESGATVIFVEHDAVFQNRVATKIVDLDAVKAK